jgi:hypothetical protein
MSRSRRNMALFMDFPAAVLVGIIARFCSSSVMHAAAVCHLPEILSIEQDAISALNLSHHLVQFRSVFLSWICYDPLQAYAAVRTTRNSLDGWYDTPTRLRARAELSLAIFMAKIRKLPSRSMPERPTVTLDTRPPK